MPGRGPAPKLTRQRKQTPARGDWVRLEPLDGPVIPELSEFDEGDGFPLRSKLLWDSWMEDPVTALWTKSDLAYAVDTIFLHAGAAQGKSAEIRLRMESLGLTPKGRRDSRLLLPDEIEPPSEAPATPADAQVAPEPEERTLPTAI